MIKRRIAELIHEGIRLAQEGGNLPAAAVPELSLEHPAQADHGDYATSVALRLARAARMKPLQIAETIVALIPAAEEIEQITVAPPGFINIRLREPWLAEQVQQIEADGAHFGGNIVETKKRIQVEYVSANPVGPLHVGTGRIAVLGDSIANVLAFAGHDVFREYYVNDAGAQVRAFGRTLLARYRQQFGQEAALPEDGYAGAYMIDLAKTVREHHGDTFLTMDEDEAALTLSKIGMALVLDLIQNDLGSLGIRFDNWYSEKSLIEDGILDETLARLRANNMLDQREGALWFSSTSLGEDKDNVIVRSNGSPTYFATDIAYHYDKFGKRGFDRVINVWGADHQGHVSRMKAVVGSLGFSPDDLHVVLAQLVTLKRGGEIVRLSKRTGDIVTLRELVDEVGKDATRFFFAARSADSQMDFDIELAKQQSDSNPVYYVQYAHARIASILRNAAERGIEASDGDLGLVSSPAELELIRKMFEFPEVVELAAENLEPHRLPHYAHALAGTFHGFYKQCKVLSEDVALSKARLRLVASTKTVLANSLHIIGVDAPERMDRPEEAS